MKVEWTNKDSLTSGETTKAILVFDKMPNSCDECEVKCTGYTAKEYAEKGIKRPSWCPLKPMPQKKIGDDLYERYGSWTPSDEREVSYRLGFNDCIEEITGGTEYRRNRMTKSLNEYTIKEFREMELFGRDCLFDSVVIVPMDELHESGYRCMKFILCRYGDIVGAVGGGSDVVHPNGIGNHGLSSDWSVTPNIGLRIDCLAGSGCVRLMMDGLYKCSDFILSDFIFYKLERKQNESNTCD